jgi:hypothetical protein
VAPSELIAFDLDLATLARSGRREGREIRFLCPAHEDTHPSARWHSTKRAWFCDACRTGRSWQDLAERLGLIDQGARRQAAADPDVAAIYSYRDAAGAVLFRWCASGRRLSHFGARTGRVAGSGTCWASSEPYTGCQRSWWRSREESGSLSSKARRIRKPWRASAWRRRRIRDVPASGGSATESRCAAHASWSLPIGAGAAGAHSDKVVCRRKVLPITRIRRNLTITSRIGEAESSRA